jgi:hypothetical protein
MTPIDTFNRHIADVRAGRRAEEMTRAQLKRAGAVMTSSYRVDHETRMQVWRLDDRNWFTTDWYGDNDAIAFREVSA